MMIGSVIGGGGRDTSDYKLCADADVGCCTNAQSHRDQGLCYDVTFDQDTCLSSKGPCNWKCDDGSILTQTGTTCPQVRRLREQLLRH